MKQINLNHNGKFYVFIQGSNHGHGFPIKATTIPTSINISLNYDILKFKQSIKMVEIKLNSR